MFSMCSCTTGVPTNSAQNGSKTRKVHQKVVELPAKTTLFRAPLYVVRWPLQQSLSVRMELDRGLGGLVGADNLLHVGVVGLQTQVAAMTSDSSDRPRVDL